MSETVAEAQNGGVAELDPEAEPFSEDPFPEDPLKFEAEYQLEFPVRCPGCHERISKVGVVRLVRSRVNFVSTFPRRGYVAVCPDCSTIVPADLSGLL